MLVFLIGDLFIDTDFSVSNHILQKYPPPAHQLVVFTICPNNEIYEKAVGWCHAHDCNSQYIFLEKEIVMKTTSKNGIVTLSIQTEHKFIDSCLKAIQIQKPSLIIINDKNGLVMTPAIKRNVVAHAQEVGCMIEWF